MTGGTGFDLLGSLVFDRLRVLAGLSAFAIGVGNAGEVIGDGWRKTVGDGISISIYGETTYAL